MKRSRDTRSIQRRKANREPRQFLLIVCEGESTEPAYFAHYKRKLRLANVGIDICGAECGSDPKSVVKYAEGRFKRDPSIDKCFCVIDRDRHQADNFNGAISAGKAINKLYKKRDFVVHVSDPCIEYWFILHFQYTRTPFTESGQKSRGGCALDKLVSLWPEYRKNLPDIGLSLESRSAQARINAREALRDAETTSEPNPSTSLHLLIEDLERMATPE